MPNNINDIIDDIKRRIRTLEAQRICIAVFGQPGAGKSSLVNNILGNEQALVSIKTDATTSVDTYEYGNLIIGDFPGYGTEQFPAEDYLSRFDVMKYDIFLCLFSGKLHAADINFFRQLDDHKRIILFVRSYSDAIWQPDKDIETLKQELAANINAQIGSKQNVIFISNIDGSGVDALLETIKELIEPAKRDAFIRSVRAETEKLLHEKYLASESLINSYCRLAALNGINPIPGLDIALDMGILFKLFAEIRGVYGLTEQRLNKAAAILPLAKQVMLYGTEWGLASLLKNAGKRVAIGKTVKYVPLIGSAISAAISYVIVKKAGQRYLRDCKMLAEKLLTMKLDEERT